MKHDLIEKTAVRQWRVVFPSLLNGNNTLFGGEIMKWMDELTYVCARRFVRNKLFTAYTEPIHFVKPVMQNDLIELTAKVEKVTPVKLYVKTELYTENNTTGERALAAYSMFIYVQLNERMAPCRIHYPFDYDKFVSECVEE